MSELKKEILKIKKKLNIGILAHSYQHTDILEIADVKGDSYVLSTAAESMKQNTILVCGVRFMAETVKILNPEKKVILVNPEAGCPMAEQFGKDAILKYKEEHPGHTVCAYVNTTAELKTVCDVCVTSSSAEKIVKNIESVDILFIPDKNLGAYIQKLVPEKNIHLLDGKCPIHAKITMTDVRNAKKAHPGAKVLMHPECKLKALELADMVGSTAAIIEHALNNDGEFIIGTEVGVYEYLVKTKPDGKFYQLSDKLVCPDMKITALDNVLAALNSNGGEEIVIDEETRLKAKHCIDEMVRLNELPENPPCEPPEDEPMDYEQQPDEEVLSELQAEIPDIAQEEQPDISPPNPSEIKVRALELFGKLKEKVKREDFKKSLLAELLDFVSIAVYSIIITVILFTFVFRMVSVDGKSMQNTLQHEDRLIVNQLFYTPKRGDIVVVTKETRANGPLIKRVIATEGQTIDINFNSGEVTVDGVVLDEPYIKDLTTTSEGVVFPQTVPPDCVFVMGDNRNNSHDSRSTDVGMVQTKYVMGEAVFRVFPIEKFGKIW